MQRNKCTDLFKSNVRETNLLLLTTIEKSWTSSRLR